MSSPQTPPQAAQSHMPMTQHRITQARYAISALYFGFGLTYATLGLNMPGLRSALALSDTQVGLGLLPAGRQLGKPYQHAAYGPPIDNVLSLQHLVLYAQ